MDQDLFAYLAAMEQRLERRSDAMEQRFDAMERRFDKEFQELRQELRQVHVVVEDIQDKVQLTAEGVLNANEKLDRHREDVSGRFNDLEALVRDSDRALASRVDRLEVKRAG
jgi:t-SNARE complex subunit (syntaxin)